MSRRFMMLGIHPGLVRRTPVGPAPAAPPPIGVGGPRAPGEQAAEADGLMAWLENVAGRRPPASSAPSIASPRRRYWPAPDRPIPLAGAAIVSRRSDLADVYPQVPEAPVGRSPRSARRGRQNRLPSMKAGRTLRLASDNEFDHALDCEMSASVTRFVEQPFTLRYTLDGRCRTAKPDAYVVERGVAEVREIKFEDEAATEENENRWPAIAAALNGMGLGYRVVTERDLRAGGRRDTIFTVYEHRHAPMPDEVDLAPLLDLLAAGPATLRKCGLQAPGVPREQVYALVRRNVLAIDYDAPLGPGTAVMLPQQARRQFDGVR